MNSTSAPTPTILYLNQAYSWGGAEVFLTNWVREWTRSGGKCTALSNYQPFRQSLATAGAHTYHLPTAFDVIGNWKGAIKALWQGPWLVAYFLFFLLRSKEKYDVVLLSGFSEKLLITPLCALFGSPCVWFEFGPLDSLSTRLGGWPLWWYCLVVKSSSAIMVPSHHTHEHLAALLPNIKEKLVYVRAGLAEEELRFELTQPPVSKKRELVCVSRLEKGKGQDLLIRSLPQVKQQFPHVHLTLVGEGDFEPALRGLVTQLDLERQVTLALSVPAATEYYQRAEVVIAPSVWELEGFGMVAVEAMAVGRPVVVFDRGPLNEIVQDRVTGLVATPGSVDSLAEQICRCLADRQLGVQLGAAGYRRVRKEFRLKTLMKVYREVFTRVTR
jgi:glycosyltransferase involved in cell wall biosynthesis